MNEEVLKREANMRELNTSEVLSRVMLRKSKGVPQKKSREVPTLEPNKPNPLVTDDDYRQKMEEYFLKIRTDSKESINMLYNLKTDPNNKIFEEPKGMYTSMNFIWDIIQNIKSKKIKFMTKPRTMLVRFIRVVKQRILKSINTTIQFDTGISNYDDIITKGFIDSLTDIINTLIAQNGVTDNEIFADNNYKLQQAIILSESMSLITGNEIYPNNNNIGVQSQNPLLGKPIPKATPKATPKPRTRVKIEPVNKLSEYKKDSIAEFQVDMDDLDVTDKLKYKEEDTPEILNGITALKSEFLNKFTRELNMIFEQDYDIEVQQLLTTQLQFYAEKLQDFRKQAHFKPSTGIQTRVGLRQKGIKIMPPVPLGTRVNNQPNVNVLPKVKKTAKALPPPRGTRVNKPPKVNAKPNALPAKALPAKALPVAKTNAEANIEKYRAGVNAMFKTLNMSKLEKLAKKPTPRGVRKTAKMNTPPVAMLNPPINIAKITELIKTMYQPKLRATRSKTKTNAQSANTLGVNTRAGPVKATKKITPKYLKTQP